MKKKPQAKQQGKPVKAGLNFSEKRRLAELKRTLAGNDKKQEKPTTAQNMILSILVDTFISKISFPMQPGPEIGSISDA